MEKGEAADLYRLMLLIRKFEDASGRLYMQGEIGGFLHLYTGQEAVAVGAISTLRADDYVIGHYRDHGHALARGMDPSVVMAELNGKATGSSSGKAGSMHLFDASRNFMGGHAIVGAQLPIAAGLALAVKYRAEDRAVLCFFGDGAVNQGEYHESLNLAALWKLPILFLLENNLYGMGSHIDCTHAAGRDIYLTAENYKIPAAQIDGMDLVAAGRRLGGAEPDPLGRRPRVPRSDDLQVSRPLHGGPQRLQRPRRGGRLAGEGPHRQVQGDVTGGRAAERGGDRGNRRRR